MIVLNYNEYSINIEDLRTKELLPNIDKDKLALFMFNSGKYIVGKSDGEVHWNEEEGLNEFTSNSIPNSRFSVDVDLDFLNYWSYILENIE